MGQGQWECSEPKGVGSACAGRPRAVEPFGRAIPEDKSLRLKSSRIPAHCGNCPLQSPMLVPRPSLPVVVAVVNALL